MQCLTLTVRVDKQATLHIRCSSHDFWELELQFYPSTNIICCRSPSQSHYCQFYCILSIFRRTKFHRCKLVRCWTAEVDVLMTKMMRYHEELEHISDFPWLQQCPGLCHLAICQSPHSCSPPWAFLAKYLGRSGLVGICLNSLTLLST